MNILPTASSQNMLVSSVAMETRMCSHKYILKIQAAAHINYVSTLIFRGVTIDLGGWIYLGSMYILQQDMLHNKGKCDKTEKYIGGRVGISEDKATDEEGLSIVTRLYIISKNATPTVKGFESNIYK